MVKLIEIEELIELIKVEELVEITEGEKLVEFTRMEELAKLLNRRVNRANHISRVKRAKREKNKSVITNRIRAKKTGITEPEIIRVVKATWKESQGRLTKNMVGLLGI